MRLIRQPIFETNSSSTHSLTMCMKETYDKWKTGELFYSVDDEAFYTPDERKILIKKNIISNRIKYDDERIENEDGSFGGYKYYYTYKGITTDEKEEHFTQENLDEITDEVIAEALDEGDVDWCEIPMTYEEWRNWLDHEDYYEEFTTPANEVVVGFGYYGYDG